VVAGADGVAKFTLEDSQLSLQGAMSIVGRTMVVSESDKRINWKTSDYSSIILYNL